MGAHAAALWRRARACALVALAATTINLAAPLVPRHVVGTIATAPGHGRPAAATTRATTSGFAPNDPFYGAPAYKWVYRQTHLSDAWRQTVGSSDVVVAVVDTGVADVPDLRGALLQGADLVGDGAADANGHGTAVASVLAARIDNRLGIAGACGRCSILPVRVARADGSASVDAIARGIAWAADHGARIVNVSIAAPSSTPALAAAVAHAQSVGALVVAAAGNTGADAPSFPAALPGVVSVGASNATAGLYPFSNHGSSVALAAPGCSVVALRDGTYDTACGTSIATPLVAGAAALLASLHPHATAVDLAAALQQTASPTAGTRYGTLDVTAALASLSGR